MKPLDVAARLLRAVPNDFYCEPCLAGTLQVSIATTREIAATLGEQPCYAQREAVCAGCGRTASALAYIPVKCARCSRAIDEDDYVVSHGEPFHELCLHMLDSSVRIADSQQMARLSRVPIRHNLERLRRLTEQG
jgi:hypothetical protein